MYKVNNLSEKVKNFEEILKEKDMRIAQLERDVSDMLNSRITRFHRCSCGHLSEIGIACSNPDCKLISPTIIYKIENNI